MGMVEYEVVEGQDPAVVAAALSEAGFRVAAREAPDTNVLQIEWLDGSGLDRANARTAIEDVRTTIVGGPPNLDPEPVSFTDES